MAQPMIFFDISFSLITPFIKVFLFAFFAYPQRSLRLIFFFYRRERKADAEFRRVFICFIPFSFPFAFFAYPQRSLRLIFFFYRRERKADTTCPDTLSSGEFRRAFSAASFQFPASSF
jgi:hypothetical protein